MFNWLQAITKVMALVKAIQADPTLLAAIKDLASLFTQPTPAPATGGGQPTMMAETHVNLEKREPEKMARLRAAFEGNREVRSVMHEGSTGKAAALDIGGLFSLFVQLLPQLIALFGLFKKPATT